jgi:hypothetical protein
MDEDDVFTADLIRSLSIRAVNQLIADVEAKRLLQSGELAETIAVCIRHSGPSQLRTLKWLLEQRELQGVPPVGKDDKPRWQN